MMRFTQKFNTLYKKVTLKICLWQRNSIALEGAEEICGPPVVHVVALILCHDVKLTEKD